MTLTTNELIDALFDTLIKVMLKNGYENINIDQLIEMKHTFKMNPIIEDDLNV